MVDTIRVVDSHTGGEGTRVVLEGGPDIGSGPLAVRLTRLLEHHDPWRSAVVAEPRGSGCLVGALLCEPAEPGCATGVLFFDSAGPLGMCGHGTIGVVATLAHLGRIGPGLHRIDTPVGPVGAELHPDGRVTVLNVPSYRHAAAVTVEVPGYGRITGDVAWGGNWFFVIDARAHGIELAPERTGDLTDFAARVRAALEAAGVTGAGGAEVDHVALFGPSPTAGIDSRDFILCPGHVYDRSPCGTGTSAKLACLHADGILRPGEIWRQEGIMGAVFEASFAVDPARPDRVLPRITGTAYVTAEATLILDERDPFRYGLRRAG
jgi:4-hydroxyproline epimerase